MWDSFTLQYNGLTVTYDVIPWALLRGHALVSSSLHFVILWRESNDSDIMPIKSIKCLKNFIVYYGITKELQIIS